MRKIREEILQAARRTLWTEEGDSVLEYLRSRGYSDDIIGLTELGAWPPELNEGTQKELSLDVPGAGTTHRLLVPMRTPAGRLAGFAVRFVGQPPPGVPKFLYPRGLARRGILHGLHRARRAGELAAFVEGWLDGEILWAYGIPALTLGGSRLTREQEVALRASRIRRVIICLDDDEAGREAARTFAERLLAEGSDGSTIYVYVVSSLDGLDPDEFIVRHGPDAFRALLRKAEPAAAWVVAQHFVGSRP
ncbi:MAG: toprim domain-containing protein [Clostridia bacterium]|nr:toprim domain-containing protein [Clostridia bacterium]